MQIAIQTTINVSGLKIVPPALANDTQCVCIMWNIHRLTATTTATKKALEPASFKCNNIDNSLSIPNGTLETTRTCDVILNSNEQPHESQATPAPASLLHLYLNSEL